MDRRRLAPHLAPLPRRCCEAFGRREIVRQSRAAESRGSASTDTAPRTVPSRNHGHPLRTERATQSRGRRPCALRWPFEIAGRPGGAMDPRQRSAAHAMLHASRAPEAGGLVGSLSSGGALCIVAVFALSTCHKLPMLKHKTAAWHPVFVRYSRIRRHSSLLLAASLILDVAIVASIFTYQQVGLTLSVIALLVYTAVGLPITSRHADCKCLGTLLDGRSRRFFIGRNALLMSLAVVAVAAGAERNPEVSTTSAVVGTALVFVVAVLARRSRAAVRNRRAVSANHVEGRDEASEVYYRHAEVG